MSALWLLPLAALAGALGRRIAGGLLSQWAGVDVGTQSQRAIWGLISALLVFAAGLPPIPAALFGLAIMAGSTYGYGIPWKGNTETTMRMGRNVGGTWNGWAQFAGDFSLMEIHGLAGVALGCVGAWYLGFAWWPLLAAGLLCGPAYALAWVWNWNIPVLGCLNDPAKGLVSPPPTAELLWGAAVGMASVFTVLGGVR